MKYSKLDIAHKRRSHNIFKLILEKYAKIDFPKILDVGCASGIIGMLRNSPKNIYGIEMNEELVKLAKNNCERVYRFDLNHFKKELLTEHDFDFIFCGDILEHLLYPEVLLKDLKALLSPNGYLIISVPNIAQLPVRIQLLFGNFNYSETGVLDKTHLHFYTYKTAQELIKTAGLRILEFFPSGTIVSYINIFPTLLSAQLIFVCKNL